MSVRFDPPGAPNYYPDISTAAIWRSSITRNTFLTHESMKKKKKSVH